MRPITKPINWIQYVTLLLVLIVALGFAYMFNKVFQDHREIAKTQAALTLSQQHQNDALKAILCFNFHRAVTVKPKGVTAEQRRQAIVFWREMLKVAHLSPCRRA